MLLLLTGCWLTPGELDAKLARDQDSDGEDVEDPDGAASIDELGPGDLVISEVMRNPTVVNDLQGEWVEVWNGSGADVDLQGLRVSDADGDGFAVPEALVVRDGGHVVFGSGTEGNGGAAIDLAWWNFALGNEYDEVILSFEDVVFDEIAYTPSWPGWEAAAASLDPGRLDAEDNDVLEAWCDAVDVYGDGDRGTPGEANPTCP